MLLAELSRSVMLRSTIERLAEMPVRELLSVMESSMSSTAVRELLRSDTESTKLDREVPTALSVKVLSLCQI